MLNVMKVDGARSSVDNGEPKRGFKGRVEVFASRGGEGFSLECVDVGNYGTERHRVTVPLSSEGLRDMIADLSSLLQGRIQSTQLETYEPVKEPVEVLPPTAETATAEAVEESTVAVVEPVVDSETQPTL